MSQTLRMLSQVRFSPWGTPLPGVELVLGSALDGSEGSFSVAEMRQLGQDCATRATHQLVGETAGELTYSDLGAPLWTGGNSQVHISISRTGQCAIGACSPTVIGVDIEFIDRNVDRLLNSFTVDEQELAKVVPPIAILCAKEAAGKATGVGLAGSITRWGVSPLGPGAPFLLVRDLHTGGQWRTWTGVIEIGARKLQCAIAQPHDPAREILHGIYESAQIELRPIGTQVWTDAVDTVRKRALSAVVITAWNPGTDRPSITANVEANQRLLARLRESCPDVWEADGFSRDRAHRESGYIAWGMQPDLGIKIAREFNQFAIFYFTANGDRSLISA
jgi:hypothetical protein